MYKILNSQGLGINGKQNELIELALTHGFNGVEVDMEDLIGRHDALGKVFACQFLQSAKIDMGTFKLPIDFGATEEAYTASVANIDTIVDLATTLNARCCYVEIPPTNASHSFQECFEAYQSRLQAIAEKFADCPTRIGLALKSSSGKEVDGEFKFIQTSEELMTLVKAIGSPKVGVCLDTWEWVVGGGTIELLKGADLGSLITEVRLADVAADADVNNIKSSERTDLPADAAGSFSYQVAQLLVSGSCDVPISVATDSSTFSSGSRDANVARLSSQLDLLIAGEDPAAIAAAAAEPAEGEGESEASTDDKTPDSTTPEPAVTK